MLPHRAEIGQTEGNEQKLDIFKLLAELSTNVGPLDPATDKIQIVYDTLLVLFLLTIFLGEFVHPLLKLFIRIGIHASSSACCRRNQWCWIDGGNRTSPRVHLRGVTDLRFPPVGPAKSGIFNRKRRAYQRFPLKVLSHVCFSKEYRGLKLGLRIAIDCNILHVVSRDT